MRVRVIVCHVTLCDLVSYRQGAWSSFNNSKQRATPSDAVAQVLVADGDLGLASDGKAASGGRVWLSAEVGTPAHHSNHTKTYYSRPKMTKGPTTVATTMFTSYIGHTSSVHGTHQNAIKVKQKNSFTEN